MTAPLLSVVVPSVNGLADLSDCLEALSDEATRIPLEILVADRCGEPIRQTVAQMFPQARLLAAPPGTTIPDLRAMAFDAAKADVVAVIEDHVIVPPGWATLMVDAHRRGEEVVGGSLYNAATERTVDWAAFLCEYSHMLAPRPAGRVDWLTGNNTAYRRMLLQEHRAAVTSGKWEDHLHGTLQEHGAVLHYHPEIRVAHKKHYSVGEYLSQRFLYARAHAGARVGGRPLAIRLGMGVAAAALPGLLFYRVVSRVVGVGRHQAELLRSLPLLTLFVCSWALGEMVGFVAGPGDALSKVR